MLRRWSHHAASCSSNTVHSSIGYSNVRTRRHRCTSYHRRATGDAVDADADADDADADDATAAAAAAKPSMPSTTPPWALMGRVVREESVWEMPGGARDTLVARAVAERCGGLGDDDLAARLAALGNVVGPSLAGRLLALHVDLLAELASDVGAVAARVVALKEAFPTADVAAIVGRRPQLLGAAEFARVPAARAALLALYGGGGGEGGGGVEGQEASAASAAAAAAGSVVDGLVERQPLLLVEDLDELLAELERLLPGSAGGRAAAADLLARNPGLITEVVCNRSLSIWLLPRGQDAAWALVANPDLVLCVERGSRRLGPGAEF